MFGPSWCHRGRCTRRFALFFNPFYLLHAHSLSFLAGGYDAIWLLVIESPSEEEANAAIVSAVEKVWLGWKEMNVSPLAAVESRESGAREESVASVLGLGALITRQQG